MASVRTKALGDLLGHHLKVWKAAWADRKRLDGPGYSIDEAAFLPAALALTEAPPSPAPRVAIWVLLALVAVAVLWAAIGKVDVVASAQGKIVPNDRTKVIQPLEVATVTAIRVTDGQMVKAGETLIELDPTASGADRSRIASELLLARLQTARARALLDAIDRQRSPVMHRPEATPESAYQEAQGWLQGQYSEYQAKSARTDADVARRDAERQSTIEMVRKLEQTLPLAQQRARDFKDLMERNFVSKHGYLEKEQVRIEQEADLATLRSRQKEQDALLREARADREALAAETRRANLDLLNDGLQKEETLVQELRKATARFNQTRLTAPVDGTVQQLAVHTVGGVVTEAQPLMVVVPRDNPVEIEAFLENKDIGFVQPGQPATVKVETFQYTRYGTIEGVVSSISDDAIQDEKRGLIYSTRIRLLRSAIDVDGRKVNLAPGMATTVEIKTGKRRVIEYFMTPLLQHAQESLRER